MRSKTSKARPRVETLEDRTLLSTCHVTRLSDAGIGMGFRGDFRYCVNKVNANPGPDDIDFHVTGTINLTSKLPDLASDIDIQGPGASLLTVRRDTGGNYTLLTVAPGANVQLSGLTLTNGGSSIGGIRIWGNLDMRATVVTGNSGAGVSTAGSAVAIITDSLISDNSSPSNAGGIDNEGLLTIERSTISGNVAANNGGGLSNFGGDAIIRDTTISGNSAQNGGGIHNAITGASSLTIINSTVSGNGANEGGGIFNNAALTVTHCTITGNIASTRGGGIDTGSTFDLNMRNSILAENSAPNGPNLKGWLSSSDHNLFDNTAGGFGYGETDSLNVDPMLGPLADNGGPTLTQALLPGSPAIDAGDNTDAPDFDQRGPGFPRVVNGTIDIGAFEVQSSPIPSLPGVQALLVTADLGDEDLGAMFL